MAPMGDRKGRERHRVAAGRYIPELFAFGCFCASNSLFPGASWLRYGVHQKERRGLSETPVLAEAVNSTIFRPPNPWLMEILSVLKELYDFADLKLNQKFEIEVLCKALDLDHKTLEASTCIRARPAVEDEYLGHIPLQV